LSSIANGFLLSCAIICFSTGLRNGAGPKLKMREKYFRKMNYGAHGDGPAVTRKKRLQVDSSEQDDQRFRIHLVRPRAVAHMWGRGARILTEISRIPHFNPVSQMRNWEIGWP